MSYIALPTVTGKLIFQNLSLKLTIQQVNICSALFQRMALVTTFEDSLEALQVQLRDIGELTAQDQADLALVYKLTKHEVLGLAVETLSDVTQSQLAAQKDKVSAATVINELYGEKELIKDSVLTDKVVLNLVRGA